MIQTFKNCVLAATLILGVPTQSTANEVSDLIKEFYSAVDAKPASSAFVTNFVADSFKDNDRSLQAPEGVSDKLMMANLFAELANGLPDATHSLDILEPISDGRAVVYWTYTGTHTGTFFGTPASGNKISLNGVGIFRVKDGKFVEQWHVEELMSLFSQIRPAAK